MVRHTGRRCHRGRHEDRAGHLHRLASTAVDGAAERWLVNAAASSCLDDPSNSLTDGTAQQLFTCSNGAVEEQYLAPPASKDSPVTQPAGPTGSITETNGKCLVPAGGTAHVGAGIVVGECDTTAARGWVATSSGVLWNGGYCATVYNGNTGSGTRAALTSCTTGSALQTWTTDSGKHLINAQSKTCMFDNVGTDGSTIGCSAASRRRSRRSACRPRRPAPPSVSRRAMVSS
jgi:hypothetical protein